MAIDIDVQDDKFPYLARQIQGDIAKAFGYGIDHVYETDKDIIEMLSKFSIENLSGKWLDLLGIVIGLPRPCITKLSFEEAFQFDVPYQMLDGLRHGFSTTVPVEIGGETYDRSNGGLIDDTYRFKNPEPISDYVYRKYLNATSMLKRTHSIKNIAEVLNSLVKSTRYAITFKNDSGYINDIVVILSATSSDYQEALQIAFNRIFTTAPFVVVDVSIYFDEIYTVPEIERIIAEVTGTTTGYTVVYSLDNQKAIFTITLNSSLSQYESEIRYNLEKHFEGADDVVIIINIA